MAGFEDVAVEGELKQAWGTSSASSAADIFSQMQRPDNPPSRPLVDSTPQGPLQITPVPQSKMPVHIIKMKENVKESRPNDRPQNRLFTPMQGTMETPMDNVGSSSSSSLEHIIARESRPSNHLQTHLYSPIQAIKEDPMENVTSSSSSSLSSEESDTEIDTDMSDKVSTTPTTHTPMGMAPGVAPPPPLRNIPHQTPDASPTTSQLFNKPASLNPSSIPPQAGGHRYSVPIIKLPGNISVLPTPAHRSDSLTVPPTKHYSDVVRSAREKQVPASFNPKVVRMSIDNSDLTKITLPNNRVVSGARDFDSDPILIEKPKPKHVNFSDAVKIERPTPPSEPIDWEAAFKMEERQAAKLLRDGGDVRKHMKNAPSTSSEGQSSTIDGLREGMSIGSTSLTSASLSLSDDSPTSQILPPFKKRQQPRAPSKLLLKKLAQNLSSSSSDSESESFNDSEEEDEKRDKFDTSVTLQPRTLPAIRERTVSQGDRPLLPPVIAGNAPRKLPPILKGAAPLTHTVSLPSYQETAIRRRTTGSTRSVPPNYYTGGREQERRVRLNCDELSDNPIHLAAMEGVGISQMKSLALQFGVDYRDSGGRTPLMYAVIGNQPKMCELLLKLKASVDSKDLTGLTPILWATYKAYPDVIRVLLKNGADVRHSDVDGRTVYHWAMKTPNVHCLKWLCKLGNIPEVVNQPDNDGLSALHWAVMSDQASHIKMLLSHTRADVSAQDGEGRAPLNYAVLNFSPSCIRAILDHNEGAVNLIDVKGRTVLHYACAEGSADCVRTLLAYRKCDIHCTDNNGTTPLHWASSANQPGLVQLLLRRGSDRAQKDNKDYTALDYAQQRGHADCVRILTSYGIQRPGSAISLSSNSRVSVNATADPPTLDEHGHVVFKRFQRQFSLSDNSMSSMDRLPADGQAQSESPGEGQGEGQREEGGEQQSHEAEQSRTSTTSQSSQQQQEMQSDNMNEIETEQRARRRRRGWKALLCCGACAKRSSTVSPL